METTFNISVVIATYNGANFIIEQLESVLHQSLPVDSVLISDDGSSDGTVEIIKEWISKNHLGNKWKVSKNSENLGYASDFMQLIENAIHADADFIFLADQDDIWLSDKVEMMIAQMAQFPSLGLLCSDLEPFYETNRAQHYGLARLKWGNKPFIRFGSQWIWALRPGCTYLLKSSFAERAIGLWHQLGNKAPLFAHDTFLWALAHIEETIGYFPYVTMKYRRHESNDSGRVSMLNENHRLNDIQHTIVYIEIFMRSVDTNKVTFMNKQKCFFQRRSSYLSKGSVFWLCLFVDGLCHLKYYVRKRHYISDLYVCLIKKKLRFD